MTRHRDGDSPPRSVRALQDEKFLRRVKWQYMVLDEAQAIKSAHSLRWRTLLAFPCRNRLLLSGTPIQNSMARAPAPAAAVPGELGGGV